MEAYTNFAEVYDTFMDNVPYEKWAEFIKEIFSEYNISDGLVLELGCGTGSMTELLAECGYDMIGVDNSADMLEIALNKRLESGHDILYLNQDMREFELYGTVKAVISVCDSINYITEPEELAHVFRLVNNYLDPKGLFLFDFNTEHEYRDVIGSQVIAEAREESCFIWDNAYDEATKINDNELTIFIQSKDMDSFYKKYQENHYQRGYTLEEIKELLALSGLTYIGAYDAYTKEQAHRNSERICVIAQEQGK